MLIFVLLFDIYPAWCYLEILSHYCLKFFLILLFPLNVINFVVVLHLMDVLVFVVVFLSNFSLYFTGLEVSIDLPSSPEVLYPALLVY